MKLAIVTPRYGEHILGGAETMARRMGEALVARGHSVQVLSTGAASHSEMRDDQPAESDVVNGVRVARFKLRQPANPVRHGALQQRIIMGARTTIDEQYEWIDSSVHSPDLYAALLRQLPALDLVLLIPYPFPLVHYAAACARHKAVLWPCLHDEGYAYTEPVRALLRESCGIQFNSEPERALMEEKLLVRHAGAHVVGFGLDRPALDASGAAGAGFRTKFGVHDPFVLYSGRIEIHKNANVLVDYFARHKRQHPGRLKLVMMGSGAGVDTQHPDIVEVGFLGQADMAGALDACTLLCQPSVNESFSIVIMEAWRAGKPVLVHADCAVTHHHVLRSNGGLAFGNYDEFTAMLDLLTRAPAVARSLGARGQAYVSRECDWDAVIARFEAAALDWISRSCK